MRLFPHGNLQNLAGLRPGFRSQAQALMKRLVVLQLHLELVALLLLFLQRPGRKAEAV